MSGVPRSAAIPETLRIPDEQLTEDSHSGSSSSSTSDSSASGTSDASVTSTKIAQLEATVALLVKQLQSRHQEAPVSQTLSFEKMMEMQERQQRAAATSFINQMKVMKEIMTVMQPPAPPIHPVYNPVYPSVNPRQNAYCPPPGSDPTFTLETMERLANMFHNR